MKGEFSWLVLVVAFVIVTGLCGILAARLGRVGSPSEKVAPVATVSAGEARATDPAVGPQ
jgi:hypothetical protein